MTGEELIKIREKLGMGRGEFGNALGIPYRTLQNYELEVRPIPRPVMKLAKSLLKKEEKKQNNEEWSEESIVIFDWGSFLSRMKLTQRDLADQLEVRQPYISRLKNEFEEGKPVPEGIIEKLRTLYDDDQISPFLHERTVKAPKGGTVIDMYSNMRPYYDIDFSGTPGAELMDPAGKVQPDNYISVPHFTDVDFYTRVTGDSMYPKFRHGDIIACKSIDTTAFFAFYEPYAIVTRTNNQRLIKYIHPHPNDPNKLLLVSYDSEKFPPQPIDRNEIFRLFQIKGKIEL